MPIYEYRCHDCNVDFEFFKHLSDEKPKCPECGNTRKSKLEKKISAGVTHVLNGTGWARDNYASSNKGKKK